MATPVLLKEFVWSLNFSTVSSRPRHLTPFGSGIVFAGELWQGEELWQSNGTAQGTRIAADIHKGVPQLNIINGPSRPSNFIPFGRSVFFAAEEPFGGRELWSFNGKNARRVKDLWPGTDGYDPFLLGVLGNKLFFLAGGAIWTSDGSEKGTKPLIFDGLDRPILALANDDIASFRGDFYFPYPNAQGKEQLWRTDGAATGTVRLPLNDFAAVFPEQLTPGRNNLFFTALNYTSDLRNFGRELWKTDGTSKGTVLVKDINPIPTVVGPTWLTMCGGYLFFSADDGIHGQELWMSDGTTKGTKLVKNIAPEILPGRTESSNPSQLTAVGDKLYFVANDGPRGPELWQTDTRNLKTAIVKDITTSHFGAGSDIRDLTPVGDKLFFTAYRSGPNGEESSLWVTDGSSGGTLKIKNLTRGIFASTISEMTLSGNKLFWTEGSELWALDVTDELTGMGSRSNPQLHGATSMRSARMLSPSPADSPQGDLVSYPSRPFTPSGSLDKATTNMIGSDDSTTKANLITVNDIFNAATNLWEGL